MRQLWLILLFMLTGCVQQQHVFEQPGGDSADLMTWLEQDLSPYLAEKMARDPRFRDQSIMLVKLNGSEIQPEIDKLTRYIRQQIKEDLLDTPGIHLPWQPMRDLPKHHRRLSQIHCRTSSNADYYIGVEITSILSNRYQVSVRALDMSEHRWLNGFGMSWQGQLNLEERRALSSLSVDESLRGLRSLPFTAGQIDMAADYLANNVSCLLQQQDEDQLLIHVQPADDRPAYMDSLLKLVANNLSRYHEVSITDQASRADYVLTLEALRVQPGLEQVWTAISRGRDSVRLSGMDTSTYIRNAPDKPAVAHSASLKPRIKKMDLSEAPEPTLCTAKDNHCGMLTVDVVDASELFIVRHHAPAQLARLLPGTCGARIQPTGENSDRHRIPFTSIPGEATYHVIAVNQHSRDTVAEHLARLPQSCESPVDSLEPVELNRWLTQLEQIMLQQQSNISWAATRTTL